MQNKIGRPKLNDKKIIDRGFWVGFAISLAICTLLTVLVISYELSTLKLSWEKEKWTILIDGFTLSGGALILTYLLTYVASEGAFDAISYGLKLAYYTTFKKNIRETKLARNYTEYKELKHGEEEGNVKFLLLAGAIFFVIGLIFYIPYSIN